MMPDQGKAVTLRARRALVGEQLRVVDDPIVVVQDGHISAIGSGEPALEDASSIDLGQVLLLPGFIDTHVHIGFYEPAEVLQGGVTTVRDLAWPPDEIFDLAARSLSASFEGPTILAAGPMLTVEGGYPMRAAWAPEGTGHPLSDPAQVEVVIAGLVQRGAVVIKVALNPPVGPTFDARLLRTIVAAAHQAGLRVTGHIYGLDELNKALDAGIDELAHMLMSPEKIPAATIARMVEQDLVVVPTLSIFYGGDQTVAIENLRAFVEAGGRVVYGTDLGNEGPKPGIDPREIEALHRAGLDTRAIVASGTVDAATWLDLNDVGVLDPGKRADIIAVAPEALEDPVALADVRFVMRHGAVRR